MKLFSALLLLPILVTSPHVPTNARNQQQEPRFAQKLSVKLTIVEGAAPSYYPLGDDENVGGGAYFDSFRKLTGPQPRGAELVEQVSVFFQRKGAGALCAVYVHARGATFPDGGKVAEFTLSEGAEYTVTQLARYGIAPIRVGLIRRVTDKLSPPRVENRTSGVEVTAVKVLEKELKFELRLRNASQKKISAVEIEEYRGWERKGRPPHFDWKVMPPLKPGGAWEVVLEVGWNFKVTPDGHAPEPADRVVIGAVVYSDGSFEGNPYFAAQVVAFELGRHRQLSRVLDIMREWGEAFDPTAALLDFGPRAETLECTAEWSEVVGLMERFHGQYNRQLDEIKSSLEAGMEWQRATVLSDYQRLKGAAASATNPAALSQWLKEWRLRYERRHAGEDEPGDLSPALGKRPKASPENER